MFQPIFAQTVGNIGPSREALPGIGLAERAAGGIGMFALIFCVIGLVLSAGMWAIGAFSNNYNQSIGGKRGFMVSAGGALMIGAAGKLIDYFYGLGGTVDGAAEGSQVPAS